MWWWLIHRLIRFGFLGRQSGRFGRKGLVLWNRLVLCGTGRFFLKKVEKVGKVPGWVLVERSVEKVGPGKLPSVVTAGTVAPANWYFTPSVLGSHD
jgi:hypothetical protein